jgi:hypothetical protein
VLFAPAQGPAGFLGLADGCAAGMAVPCPARQRASKRPTAMPYFALLTLHLFAALIFVGTVFFEILFLEGIREPVGRDAMRQVETAIGHRARRLMPFVVATLYAAGIGMAWTYRDVLSHPLDSGFATLLTIKIILAISVLGHFIAALTLSARRKLKSRHFKAIHISVFCHMVLIVLLAKAMFYVSW